MMVPPVALILAQLSSLLQNKSKKASFVVWFSVSGHSSACLGRERWCWGWISVCLWRLSTHCDTCSG